MNILVVDDDEDDRKLFFETTREIDSSINCIEAVSAQDALVYLRGVDHALPDYIFLDLRMPGLSGQDCLKEIKKDARLAPVPVIVYTTSRDEKEALVLKGLGAAHFMSKPVFPDDVFYMISFVLGEKWS